MRKPLMTTLYALTVILLISCESSNKKSFEINIKINGTADGLVYMQQNEEGKWIRLDLAEMKNGVATFTGDVEMPEMFYFSIENQRGLLPVFVENSDINIIGDINNLRNPKVEGSNSQHVYQLLTGLLAEFDGKERALSQQFRTAQSNNNSNLMDSISNAYDELENKKKSSILEYAVKNNSSVVAPFIMMNYSYLFDLEDLESVVQKLNPSVTDSKYTSSLNERINILKRVAIGQHFVDFTLDDPEGNPLPLSSKTGANYILLDFWASWCRPCRAENPNVVAAFNRFHDKGFDVFGVSLDRDHDNWVEAIKQDDLTWTHVSDLKYWGSAAAKLYGVQSIPHNVLLDPEGIIIAKNLRGANLQNKLAELLD